jgi:hypothetical protein
VQFPEFEEEGGSLAEHAESMMPLRQLARAWQSLARLLISERRYEEAAGELVGVGEMAHLLCCGESFVMHYLLGSAVMQGAGVGMRWLAAEEDAPASALHMLSAAVDRWIAEAGRAAQCLRVDLCSYALPEIERLAACRGMESLLEQLLDRHYASAPLFPEEDGDATQVHPDDDRLAWRRESMLRLLDGHGEPFDPIATVRQLGRLAADQIAVVERQPASSLAAWWRRLGRSYRRSRFRASMRYWPAQFHPGFPYEYLGPGDNARERLAECREHVSARHWQEMQPPSDAQLQAARERLRLAPNALGLLIADALLPVDLSVNERLRRARLAAVRETLSR